MNLDRNESFSPVLAHKADVEFTPLQVFTGVTHDLVEGVLQEVIPAYDESESTHTHKNTVTTAKSPADYLLFSIFIGV